MLRTTFALLMRCVSGAPARARHLSSRPNSTLVPPVRPFRLPPRTGVETQMEISLDQTLAMALANNKDIESARIDRVESDYMLIAAQGAFDPQLNVTVIGSSRSRPSRRPWADRPAEAC